MALINFLERGMKARKMEIRKSLGNFSLMKFEKHLCPDKWRFTVKIVCLAPPFEG